MPQQARQNLFDNLAGPLSQVPREILDRQLALFDQCARPMTPGCGPRGLRVQRHERRHAGLAAELAAKVQLADRRGWPGTAGEPGVAHRLTSVCLSACPRRSP